MTGAKKDIQFPLEQCRHIYQLARALKMQERKIIDFSVPVNPLGVSRKVKAELRKHLKYLDRYPDPEAERLRERLARYFSIDPQMILCGNGSMEILSLLTRVLRPVRILIAAPASPEYERVFLMNPGSSISYVDLKGEDGFQFDADRFIGALPEGGTSGPGAQDVSSPCAMAFLCNPNYPAGKLLSRRDVLRIAEAARNRRCYLMVHEALIDFCPDDSVITDAAVNPFLLVIRTLSFYYSLAGLRIGYGIFPPPLVRRLNACREPWTVNSLAQRAALTALSDNGYRKETTTLIAEEKRFLEKQFRKLGIEFFPSDVHYYLLRMQNAREVSGVLKKRGILVGDCTGYRGLGDPYLSISVQSHRENATLMKELAGILNRR